MPRSAAPRVGLDPPHDPVLPPAEPLALDPVVAAALPGNPLDAVSKLDDETIRRGAVARVAQGVQSTGASADWPRANVISASARNRRAGIDARRAGAIAKRLGEAPEELLRRVRAAVPERGPVLVPRQRREDVQQRGARAGGKAAGLGDGWDQVHGVPGDGRGERQRRRRAVRGRVNEAVGRPPERVMCAPGQHADRAAVREADPRLAELAPRAAVERRPSRGRSGRLRAGDAEGEPPDRAGRAPRTRGRGRGPPAGHP